MAKILDGKIVRDKIADNLRSQVSGLRSRPKLVIIQVGDLAESNTYIRQKILFGEKIGAIVEHKKFDENITQELLRTHISKLNTDRKVTGIIVQLPIPAHLDKDKIIDAIDPNKDVDGLTSTNIKLLWESPSHSVILGSSALQNDTRIDSGQARMTKRTFQGFLPATTKGILTLCDFYKIPITGKKVVVVGRSFLVGKPTALAFLNLDATVTICHRETKNLKQETRNADILVVAIGKANLITKDHVKPGQVVIDVGINVILSGLNPVKAKPETEPNNRKIVGDVDFENVSKIVKAITSVPGGIGPMTVASLFENLLAAYNRQQD